MESPTEPICGPEISAPSTARRNRRFRLPTLALVALAACGIAAWAAWRTSTVFATRNKTLPLLSQHPAPPPSDPEMEARVVAFCSDCHTLPRAENLPRDRWHLEVQRGYEFYARSERNDLDPPPLQVAVAYFRARAPEKVVFPRPVEARTSLRATFSVQELTLSQDGAGTRPEISHLRWARLAPDDHDVLLFSDLRFGYVALVDFRKPNPTPHILTRLNHPCHIEPCDLDGDGATDLLVADLGSTAPSDHDRGQVVWLRRDTSSGRFDAHVLVSGLGRVADVRAADFDRDGRLDLIVAEFGHYRTGGIYFCKNIAQTGERPRFEREKLDDRPGTIHVPIYDFNGDGLPDFVAVVSQEWEHVDAFLNRGQGRFQVQNLWAGPDLMFGSSGIELVDLDGDGDQDILYTNGDAFDNWYANPSHGVQWLENLGEMRFQYHRLTDLPGAYRALAGDIDGDGDQDIVVVAWLPAGVMPGNLLDSPLASILCLEQTEPGVFVRHTLETGSPYYATFELADFDGDGDLDFAVRPGPKAADSHAPTPWLKIWWNQRIDGKKK